MLNTNAQFFMSFGLRRRKLSMIRFNIATIKRFSHVFIVTSFRKWLQQKQTTRSIHSIPENWVPVKVVWTESTKVSSFKSAKLWFSSCVFEYPSRNSIPSFPGKLQKVIFNLTGQFGGIRAAMQLREFMSELMTVHMPAMVGKYKYTQHTRCKRREQMTRLSNKILLSIVIPKVHETLRENGSPTDSDGDIVKAARTMIKQLEWYADAMKKQRQVRFSKND